MSARTIGEKIIDWAASERSVLGLVLIGSRARKNSQPDSADEFSDWDFHVITSRPEVYSDSSWLDKAGLSRPCAYVFRDGRLGQAPKASAVFFDGEVDLVILSAARLARARLIARLGLGNKFGAVRKGLESFALVLASGYCCLKGEREWGGFLAQVVSDFQRTACADDVLCAWADGFVVDYVSARRKIQRGEFIAARRWLHHQLIEVNFKLLHEWLRRSDQLSYPDARRLEYVAPSEWVSAFSGPTGTDRASLTRATVDAAKTMRELMERLVGAKWTWPRLPLGDDE